ncbi:MULTISPECIES: hypothetical protein [unclassified Oceanobacillus]|uniref:hypothetical protein n=1 Tax=unclassified Oceanobacillus TaxID=2630292 RepID=UPI002035ADCC|nr:MULTISPECIES: hypothetical protein [unclassified Oceanobacillus]
MIKKGDCMKKAALFICSVIIVYFVLQVGSGMILTTLYVPNISEVWLSIEGLLPEITFGSSSIVLAPVLIFGVLSTFIAYAITLLFSKKLNIN